MLEVRDLTATFNREGTPVQVVNRIGFDIAPGEAVGFVGESGSGKSVTARAVMRLAPAAESEPFGEVFSFPNPAPAGSPITWRVHIDQAREFRIRLVTLDGRLAASSSVAASLAAGPDGRLFQDIEIDTAGLAPGSYVGVIEAIDGDRVHRTSRRFSLKP